MARVHRQRREHRENFLLKITPRPGGAFRVELRDVMDSDVVFRQERRDLVVPKRVLRRHQLVHLALDGVERFGRAQSVRPDVARLALDLLLDAGDADLEKLIEVRAERS